MTVNIAPTVVRTVASAMDARTASRTMCSTTTLGLESLPANIVPLTTVIDVQSVGSSSCSPVKSALMGTKGISLGGACGTPT